MIRLALIFLFLILGCSAAPEPKDTTTWGMIIATASLKEHNDLMECGILGMVYEAEKRKWLMKRGD